MRNPKGRFKVILIRWYHDKMPCHIRLSNKKSSKIRLNMVPLKCSFEVWNITTCASYRNTQIWAQKAQGEEQFDPHRSRIIILLGLLIFWIHLKTHWRVSCVTRTLSDALQFRVDDTDDQTIVAKLIWNKVASPRVRVVQIIRQVVLITSNIHVPWAHTSLTLNDISMVSAVFFKAASVCPEQTDHSSPSVAIGRVYSMHAMRPK